MKYLLDANAWIAYMRGVSPSIAQRLRLHSVKDLFLCSIVLTELRFGVLLSDPKHANQNKNLLDYIEKQYASLPFDDPAAIEAAAIKFELRKQGTQIGEFDLLIGAIARVNKYTLVTHNTGEFSRIPNLLIEDWQI